VRVLNDIDNAILQCAINALAEWANSWQLIISIEKCCVISIGNANCMSNFNIDGNTLPIVTSCRDFGVVVTHNLFPSTHIDALWYSKPIYVLTLSTGLLFHVTQLY